MKQTDLKHFMNTSKSIQKLVGFLGVWTLLLSAISSSTTVASSLNPLAEDGGAIPPDSPAVAVSALESSVKGIYKKKWTILWLSCPGWLVVIMIHHHCIWNKPICAQSLSTNAKGCWCFGQMLLLEYCEKAGVPIWQTPLTCEAVHAKFSMQSRDLITTEPWSCQWLCMCQRTRAFIFAMLLSSSAMDNLLLLC